MYILKLLVLSSDGVVVRGLTSCTNVDRFNFSQESYMYMWVEFGKLSEQPDKNVEG